MKLIIYTICFMLLGLHGPDSTASKNNSDGKARVVNPTVETIKPKADQVTDSADTEPSSNKCYYLLIGKVLEKDGRLTEAYEAYTKALECKDSVKVHEAYTSIERLSTYEVKVSSYYKGIIYSSPFLVVVLLLLWRLVLRIFSSKRKPVVHVNPLKVSPSGGDTNEYISASIEWSFSKRNEYKKQRKRVSDFESEGVKPSFKTNELSASESAINPGIPEDYWKILLFLFELVDRPKFIVVGQIHAVEDEETKIFVRLNKGRKIIRIWQLTVEPKAFSETLEDISYEVVVEIESHL